MPARPSGDPIAITGCPTRRSAEEPIATGVSPDIPETRTTAMSLVGSVPTTVNGAVRPSWKVTVVFAAAPPPGSGPGLGAGPGGALGLAAAAMTWLLVMIRPSDDRMMPEPSSD